MEVEMKRSFINAVCFIVLFIFFSGVGCSFADVPKDNSLTVQEFLDQCKKDIAEMQDEKSFLASYCGGRIGGFLEGYHLQRQIIEISTSSDKCEKEKYEFFKEATSRVCIENESSVRNIAMDIVQWIEETIPENGKDIKALDGRQILMSSLPNIYPCKK